MISQGITVLGSTGSIGESTLNVLARHAERYHVVALSAHRNINRLAEQCLQHNARYAAISDPAKAGELQLLLDDLGCKSEVIAGSDALSIAACMDETDTVMAAIVGAAGLESTFHAVQKGKRLLLANKESMVIAGELFRKAAAENAAIIIPVDSEHNALFQVLPENFDAGLENAGVERLILTASGGPFLHRERHTLQNITPDEACNHPNWDMGRKISIDSATLMNKGLEVIEAYWLFDVALENIEVLVHPQSIVHSLVEFVDGSVVAQLGIPDMRVPISYALSYPERLPTGLSRLSLTECSNLSFLEPDTQRFTALKTAYEAIRIGGCMPAVLNAANEVAVAAFLDGKLKFPQISKVVAETMARMDYKEDTDFETILAADHMARIASAVVLQEIAKRNTADD